MRTQEIFLLLAGLLGVGLIASVGAVLLLQPSQPPTPVEVTVEFRIIGGSVGEGKALFGFGLENQKITSPGPTLKVKLGDTVRIVFTNVDEVTPHTLALVAEAKEGAEPIYQPTIGTPTKPIEIGKSGVLVFKVDRLEKFYYVCSVPGHTTLGMHGEIVVEG